MNLSPKYNQIFKKEMNVVGFGNLIDGSNYNSRLIDIEC